MPFKNILDDPQQQGGVESPWLPSFIGLSYVFAALGMVSQAYLGSSIKLLVLGLVIETGRRVFQWLTVRFRFQYSTTALFDEGDQAYEWLVLFLTQESVWRRSREFVVNATNSRRKWSVKTWVDPTIKGNAEYVPTYRLPQLFRWRGHWIEIKRTIDTDQAQLTGLGTYQHSSSIFVTTYAQDINLLWQLVEDARARYVSINQPHVIIHLADSPPHYGPDLIWNNVKRKTPRPLNSIILPEGVVDALVCDAKEFISTEDWYVKAGIPHRRGYLLYGPSGSGKTSTIYALAGALNLEIYSLSLASRHVDDSFLQRAASLIPKHAIFLIEDIDCAFASRDDEEELEDSPMKIYGAGRPGPLTAAHGARSLVTLSGLLNVIDGVGSEEGNLFFATTNYIDHLDPALLRPGRIDRKIAPSARPLYALLPCNPVSALRPPADDVASTGKKEATKNLASEDSKPEPDIHGSTDTETLTLAAAFSASIPPAEFTTAELQCYLQGHKTSPVAAVEGAPTWVTEQLGERHDRDVREKARKRRTRQQREEMDHGNGGRWTRQFLAWLP
ncbi:P-loop containing nucleoside triphosphate hydrolase protein [Mycena sp. CBHHK59/15]|nr:P-loop containing nucleoside triphosphate hydrolase protein [Mycena sp. CBHHK59/15]